MDWNWTEDKERILFSMFNHGATLQAVANRFDCSIEEVSKHLDEIRSKTTGESNSRSLNAMDEAVADKVQEYDAVQLAFISLCEAYNNMGDDLKSLAELIVEHNANKGEVLFAAREAAGSRKLSKFAELVVSRLHDKFIMIPRRKAKAVASIDADRKG